MERKREYVKPEIRVADWDLSEDLCQLTYRASPCINVNVPNGGGIDAIDDRENYSPGSGAENNWQKWPSGGN